MTNGSRHILHRCRRWGVARMAQVGLRMGWTRSLVRWADLLSRQGAAVWHCAVCGDTHLQIGRLSWGHAPEGCWRYWPGMPGETTWCPKCQVHGRQRKVGA